MVRVNGRHGVNWRGRCVGWTEMLWEDVPCVIMPTLMQAYAVQCSREMNLRRASMAGHAQLPGTLLNDAHKLGASMLTSHFVPSEVLDPMAAFALKGVQREEATRHRVCTRIQQILSNVLHGIHVLICVLFFRSQRGE